MARANPTERRNQEIKKGQRLRLCGQGDQADGTATFRISWSVCDDALPSPRDCHQACCFSAIPSPAREKLQTIIFHPHNNASDSSGSARRLSAITTSRYPKPRYGRGHGLRQEPCIIKSCGWLHGGFRITMGRSIQGHPTIQPTSFHCGPSRHRPDKTTRRADEVSTRRSDRRSRHHIAARRQSDDRNLVDHAAQHLLIIDTAHNLRLRWPKRLQICFTTHAGISCVAVCSGQRDSRNSCFAARQTRHYRRTKWLHVHFVVLM